MSPLQGLLAAFTIILVGGLGAGLLSRFSPSKAIGLAVVTNWLGSGIGLVAAFQVLLGGGSETLVQTWSVPMGTLALRLDSLAAFFLIPTLVISALAALYGRGYLHGKAPFSWLWFNLMVAALLLVLLSADGLLFLMAWEAMSVSSFLLVIQDDFRPEVRRAGLVYLVATHIGTAFLLVLFLIVPLNQDTMLFPEAGSLAAPTANLAFLLALVGFGTKAGFVPAHVWLPEAHPAAPSHVSAFLSGVILKSGVYGLLRVVTWAGVPPAWWGWTLIGVGLGSGILGVVFALAQCDIKRLLAYSSVENLGIISLGLGLGLLGVSVGSPLAGALGLAGGLLHVWNHACFKSLLFLGAGAVGKAAGTLNLELMGGLLRRMPRTGWTFLTGSAAISGLPPLNGFVSEFLIFLAGLELLHSAAPLAGLTCLGGLALISGLAVACFARAFGIIFLGEPRSIGAEEAQDPEVSLRLPLILLALLCAILGLFAPLLPKILAYPVGQLGGNSASLAAAMPSVVGLTGLGAAAAILAACLGFWSLRMPYETEETWGCGYTHPTSRMEYTGTSFAQPLVDVFRFALRPRQHIQPARGFFPVTASFLEDSPDAFERSFYRPFFTILSRLAARLRVFQHGEIQLYLLYILITLVGLFVWEGR